jgi:hypothetical protein
MRAALTSAKTTAVATARTTATDQHLQLFRALLDDFLDLGDLPPLAGASSASAAVAFAAIIVVIVARATAPGTTAASHQALSPVLFLSAHPTGHLSKIVKPFASVSAW